MRIVIIPLVLNQLRYIFVNIWAFEYSFHRFSYFLCEDFCLDLCFYCRWSLLKGWGGRWPRLVSRSVKWREGGFLSSQLCWSCRVMSHYPLHQVLECFPIKKIKILNIFLKIDNNNIEHWTSICSYVRLFFCHF